MVQGKVRIEHISTNDQIVDVFTMSPSRQRFEFTRDRLTLVVTPFLLKEGEKDNLTIFRLLIFRYLDDFV